MINGVLKTGRLEIMKYEIKGKLPDGSWKLFNYYTCNNRQQLQEKLANILLVSKYIGIDATLIEE